MRICHNIATMNELAYHITKRGFQLTSALLGIGCIAILEKELFIAGQFQQLSALTLLLTALITPYIALKKR